VVRSAASLPCRPAEPIPDHLGQALVETGRRAGLAAVGIAGAGAFERTRRDLEDRKRAGLHAGMQFTYRNPERSTDPTRILPGARSLVVGAWSYRQGDPEPSAVAVGAAPDGSRPQGQVARYARQDHYADLRTALALVADHLVALGWRARVVSDDNALVDRAAAHRAGLGWFGKNSLLLLPGAGSWFVLGSVVTDAPLTPTGPADPMAHGEGCGSCTRCLTACPTGALVAPGVLDARRCLAWLVQAEGSIPEEHREALGGRIYGCDECQMACPINKVVDRRRPLPAPTGPGGAEVDLLALLDSTDRELLAAHGRWYIAGRQPRFLRRNALVALGNVGDGRDPATAAALSRWMADRDTMLAEHARWAARRLGRSDLVPSEEVPDHLPVRP
jgi:epoxyqueuosine reductase